MKKRVLLKMGLVALLFCAFFIRAEDVSAFHDYVIKIGETLSVKGEYGFERVDIEGGESIIKIKVEIANVSIYNHDGNVVDDTVKISLAEDEEDDEEKKWYVRNGETLTFTDYADMDIDVLYFKTDAANDFSLDVKITKESDAELKMDCHKPVTMKDTGLKKIRPRVYYGDADVTEYVDYKVKASKKYLVEIDTSDVDINGCFFLSGNYKSGRCKITVTAKYGGQTCSDSFVLNVTSTLKKNLYVLGELYSYNTRSNTFAMSLTNRSKKKIVIYSNEAVALDDDYVSFDRNVKMTRNRKRITINPGKSATIGWKVIGSTTWYEVDDFEIHFKCKYKGKTHWLSVQEDTVYAWRKGKWRRMSLNIDRD